jgi:hypothetical protein
MKPGLFYAVMRTSGLLPPEAVHAGTAEGRKTAAQFAAKHICLYQYPASLRNLLILLIFYGTVEATFLLRKL